MPNDWQWGRGMSVLECHKDPSANWENAYAERESHREEFVCG